MFEPRAVSDDKEMITRFATDRQREYQEFATRAQGLLDEVAKETAAAEFTFAEFEEGGGRPETARSLAGENLRSRFLCW